MMRWLQGPSQVCAGCKPPRLGRFRETDAGARGFARLGRARPSSRPPQRQRLHGEPTSLSLLLLGDVAGRRGRTAVVVGGGLSGGGGGGRGLRRGVEPAVGGKA